MIEELKDQYRRKRPRIRERLKDFRRVWELSDKKIFSELCFCVCTPQSKAVYCDKAIKGLEKNGALYTGNISQIRSGLKAVRFPNNKAKYIFENRKVFTSGRSIRIKDKIDTQDIVKTREWLVKNVKGIGLKEASHFLRNIGHGDDLAILDVHILRNMVKYRLIEEMPKTLSRKTYLKLEEKLRLFADSLGVSMGELDILFWSNQTGIIFK